MKNSLLSAKQAVESGYLELMRFDPETQTLKVDSENQSITLTEFLKTENRFKNL